MIHDKICTYEVARLAKDKGFRERCIGHYYDDTKDLYRSSNPQCYNFGGNTSDAPTQSLLQRWLREEKGLHISIPLHKGKYKYFWAIDSLNRKVKKEDIAYNLFDTYELALEDALKYALENLI